MRARAITARARWRLDLLRARGISQAHLAERLGVSQPTVSNVLRDMDRSERVARGIARLVGIPFHMFFADIYPEQGANNGTRTTRRFVV